MEHPIKEVVLDEESFGARLRKLLDYRHMTVVELSSKSEISRQAINNYLHEGAIPGLDSVMKIADVLDVTLGQLAVLPLENLDK